VAVKNKVAMLAVSLVAIVIGCTHMQKDMPLPPEGESAVRTTEEEDNTNFETPSASPQEAGDADVQVKF
jgi:hypothetical protein